MTLKGYLSGEPRYFRQLPLTKIKIRAKFFSNFLIKPTKCQIKLKKAANNSSLRKSSLANFNDSFYSVFSIILYNPQRILTVLHI